MNGLFDGEKIASWGNFMLNTSNVNMLENGNFSPRLYVSETTLGSPPENIRLVSSCRVVDSLIGARPCRLPT